MALDDEWRLGHRPGLDQLRGVAVLMVLVGHGLRDVEWFTPAPLGVALFFVLSGFLITRLLLEERRDTGHIRLGQFYARRVRRLLPALALAAVLLALTSTVYGIRWFEPAVASLGYMANYAWIAEGADAGTTLFTPMWSLAVEEHFYLLWPALVIALPTAGVARVSILGAFVVMVARLVETDGLEAYAATHYRIDAILIGAAGAALITKLGWLRFGAVPATALLGWLTIHHELFVGWGATAAAVAGMVLVVAMAECNWRIRWLEHVGAISYGTYLLHRIVEQVSLSEMPWLPLPLHAGVLVLGGLALGHLSWALVERRFRRPRHVSGGAAAVEREVRPGDEAAEAGGERDDVDHVGGVLPGAAGQERPHVIQVAEQRPASDDVAIPR